MKVVIYLYHMDQPGTWGENFELDYSFETKRWYRLIQRIKMNAVGQSNGEIQVWVDDQEVLVLRNIRFRTAKNVKIDQFYFSTFYGGNTRDWAPEKDESIYFDEFRIYTDPADAGVMTLHENRGISMKSGYDKIFIKVEDALITGVELGDIKGNRILELDCKGRSSYWFSTGELPVGVYIIRVVAQQRQMCKRFAVTR